jgi:hypothetical protein
MRGFARVPVLIVLCGLLGTRPEATASRANPGRTKTVLLTRARALVDIASTLKRQAAEMKLHLDSGSQDEAAKYYTRTAAPALLQARQELALLVEDLAHSSLLRKHTRGLSLAPPSAKTPAADLTLSGFWIPQWNNIGAGLAFRSQVLLAVLADPGRQDREVRDQLQQLQGTANALARVHAAVAAHLGLSGLDTDGSAALPGDAAAPAAPAATRHKKAH